MTLCAWRRRTLRRGRMSGATPSRTCMDFGHPCVVGGQIVLVYEVIHPTTTSRCASGGDGRGAGGGGLGRPGRGVAAAATHTPSGLHPARAHTLPSHHTHPGCRRRRPALDPGAVRRNGIPGVRRVISGVIDPRGCGRPRAHAAAGTTGVGRCGVAAVRGGAGRRGPHPTPHNHSPCPHEHTECSCAWTRHRWSVAVCVMSCAWRGGGGREAVRPGHHTAHSLPEPANKPQPSRAQTKHTASHPWPPTAPAAGPAAGVSGRRCRRHRHRFRRHGTPLSHHGPACLSGVRPWRRRRLSRLGTGREPAARAQLRLVAGTLAACPEVPGHVSITSHRAHRPPRALLRQPLHPIRRVASMCRASGLVDPTRHGHGAAHLGAGCGDAEPVHPRPPARRHHTPHPAHAPAAPSRPPLTPTFSDMGAIATLVTAQANWTPNTELETSTEAVSAEPSLHHSSPSRDTAEIGHDQRRRPA